MQTTFQKETAGKCFPDTLPLLEEHWREVAHYQDIELDPDLEVYAAAEAAGMLRVFTARTLEGKMIGYAVFFCRTNPHYRNSLQANQDVLFISKEHRGMGGRFILWCDEQLRSEGVQVVYHHVKAAHNFGKLLERFGYTLVDLIYSRRLDKNG